jgi:S1-C subfamily serine protease
VPKVGPVGNLAAGSQFAPGRGASPEGMDENSTLALPPTRHRRAGVLAVAALGTVGVATGVVLGVTTAPNGTSTAATQVVPAANGSLDTGTGSAAATTTASSAQQAGIVDIDSVLGYQGAEAAGTGMILTSDGEVLTNNHVVDGATSIQVTVVRTGSTYTATVVGTDPTDDVAVLQLDGASGLPTALLSGSPATVGEAVTAVGNAGGTGTLTAVSGTVTALDQSITATDSTGGDAEQLTGLIETDAAVQPGDSGGPLYGDDGTIVGMDTAASSGGPTQAYAVPIATAEEIAAQIESGVPSATVQQGYPAFLGVSVGDGVTGVTVQGVLPDGPAASAGITAGDVIIGIGGSSIGSAADLSSALAEYSPGQQVIVTWTDPSGGTQSATVTLATGPAR